MMGLNAEDVSKHQGIRTKAREKFARVKTLMDIHLLKTKLRHLGDPIQTTGATGAEDEKRPAH